MKGAKDLESRIQCFIEKLDKKGMFEYIDGYTTIKDEVLVKHKKCGHTVFMKAYNVAYADIDLCKECGRQTRDFEDKVEELKEINDDFKLVGKIKNKFDRYIYVIECKDCGCRYKMPFSRIEGFKCCDKSANSIYDVVAEKKGIEIYNQIRKVEGYIEPNILWDYLFDILKTDTMVECRAIEDIERLTNIIEKYILGRYSKEQVGVCKCCGRVKSGTRGWGRRENNFQSKICVDCAKESKVCACCGVAKMINRYPVVNGAISDTCKRCSNK